MGDVNKTVFGYVAFFSWFGTENKYGFVFRFGVLYYAVLIISLRFSSMLIILKEKKIDFITFGM